MTKNRPRVSTQRVRLQLLDASVRQQQAPDAVDVDDVLGSLSHLQATLEGLVQAREDAVRLARMGGATWRVVGQALDVSAQAAQQRFGDTA